MLKLASRYFIDGNATVVSSNLKVANAFKSGFSVTTYTEGLPITKKQNKCNYEVVLKSHGNLIQQDEVLVGHCVIYKIKS